MAHLKFLADHIYTPSEDRRVSVKYLAGKTYQNVRREAAEQAMAADKAEKLPTPRRPGAPRTKAAK